MTVARTAIVTGANKGIGLAIVRQLALQYPKSKFNDGPLLIYATARDEARGQKALEVLRSDPVLKKHKALQSEGGSTELEYHQLDVADSRSIEAFLQFISKRHPDGIDFLINNAAVALQGFDSNVVHDTMKINYHGTLEVMHSFLPFMRPGARLVNVSSAAGQLSRFSPQLAKRCRDAKSLEDVSSMLQEFEDAVAAGREQEAGFKSAAYATSKLFLNIATRIIADEYQKSGSRVLINCCNPGWVVTDMTKGKGVKQPDEGAQTPVYLTIGDIGDRTGLYWNNEKVEDF